MGNSHYVRDFEINKVEPPANDSERELPIERLEPKAFEMFCYDIISKNIEKAMRWKISHILPIGKPGERQYGADIFAKQITNNGQTIYSLYEVKRVEKYTLDIFKKTVGRFLENYSKWNLEISEFHVYIASNLSASEIPVWEQYAKQMSFHNIAFFVVPRTKIIELTREFPEIIFKYFHKAWVERLFGKQAVFHFENYGVFEFKESESWIGYSEESKNITSDTLTVKNDHVKLQAFLPTLKKNNTCCMIELRNGRFSHVSITLNNSQMVNTYFIGTNTPIENRLRPFIIKSITEGNYFCDLGNCRISLSESEIICLCSAIDFYWYEYKKRILYTQSILRSKDFRHITSLSGNIALMRIRRGLWGILLDFANAHDAFKEENEWNIFDQSHGIIKVFTKHKSQHMEAGYHAFIIPYASNYFYENFRNANIDVVLSWQPPIDGFCVDFENKFGPRYYWDAVTTHNWLRDELIPAAIEWNSKNTRKTMFEKFFNIFKWDHIKYNPDNYLTSFYQPIIEVPSSITRVEDFLVLIEHLQSHFHSKLENIFLSATGYRSLFSVIYKVMEKSALDDFRYLHGNLSYLQAKNQKELIIAIKRESETATEGCSNSFKIDCALRCIQVCIRDGICTLNITELQILAEKLKELIELVTERRMLEAISSAN